MAYAAKTTGLGSVDSGDSPRRRRTIREAVELLDEARLTHAKRLSALARIRHARQPKAEARRIVKARRRNVVPESANDDLDLSHVQELWAKLVRRDGGVWQPQSMLLARIERGIAGGTMGREEFERLAGVLLSMPQMLPKSFRKRER